MPETDTGVCDTLLVGGRVIDPETGLDSVADVAVADGTIVGVGSGLELEARQTIDASGKVVTSGFIDLHSHAQTIPSLRRQAQDGVTTALELEAGARDIREAVASASEEGRPTNFGYSASWAQARMAAMGIAGGSAIGFARGLDGSANPQRSASTDELARVVDTLEREISAGALGIGVLLGYVPRSSRHEFVEVAALAARLNVPTYTHARSRNPDASEGAVTGINEIVAAAAATGAHMHICHLNSTSLRAIGEAERVLADARELSLRVTTEAYPYGSGMTAVGAPFLDPANLVRLGLEPHDLVIVASGERPRDAARLQVLRRESPESLVIIHYLDDELDAEYTRRALLIPDAVVASDALPFIDPNGSVIEGDRPMPGDAISHPRSSGTFSRFIRTVVRESNALDLAEALRRCSLLPAMFLQDVCPSMQRKGRVQVGCDADLIVFDPDQITDRSTYEAPAVPSDGLRYVFVGGEAVVADGALSSALPGRPIVGGAA